MSEPLNSFQVFDKRFTIMDDAQRSLGKNYEESQIQASTSLKTPHLYMYVPLNKILYPAPLLIAPDAWHVRTQQDYNIKTRVLYTELHCSFSTGWSKLQKLFYVCMQRKVNVCRKVITYILVFLKPNPKTISWNITFSHVSS